MSGGLQPCPKYEQVFAEDCCPMKLAVCPESLSPDWPGSATVVALLAADMLDVAARSAAVLPARLGTRTVDLLSSLEIDDSSCCPTGDTTRWVTSGATPRWDENVTPDVDDAAEATPANVRPMPNAAIIAVPEAVATAASARLRGTTLKLPPRSRRGGCDCAEIVVGICPGRKA
jgi:hypothetical protein